MSNQQVYRVPMGFNMAEIHPTERSDGATVLSIPYLVDFFGKDLTHTLTIRQERLLDTAADNLGGIVLRGVTDNGWLVTAYKESGRYMLRNDLLSQKEQAEILAIKAAELACGEISMDPAHMEGTVTFLPQSQASPEEAVA